MKKILGVILVLLFAFALIRITTSIYENKKRSNDEQVFSVSVHSVMSSFFAKY